MDHLDDQRLVSWDELKDELGFSPAELAEIETKAKELIAQARATSRR